MTKKILILTIVASIVISSIPLAEGTTWSGFMHKIGLPFGTEIYEVSDTVVKLEGDFRTTVAQLRCLDDDHWLDNQLSIIAVPPLENEEVIHILGIQNIREGSLGNSNAGKIIGRDVTLLIPPSPPQAPPFDITYTVSTLCRVPSPINDISVGGILLQPDTTTLLLAYGIANLVWMAPTALGIGIGVYLMKSKWKR